MKFRFALLGLISLLPQAFAAPAQPEALFIVTGDQHSAYERTAQLVGLVDRLKAEHPGLPMAILLNGDTQEYGNAIAQRTGGAIDFAMYAQLAKRAPTLVNLGNHEPEFYDVAETVKRIEATGARVVGNIASRETGRLFAPASRQIRLGDNDATVVGVTTDKLATYRVAIRPSLDLANPAVWARANFPKLLQVERVDPNALDRKRVGVNALHLNIVVSHAGIAADREMLPLVPDGTLFAGAHDHQRFVEPFGRTVYFHSGSWNSHVSLAWLERDAEGRARWTVEQVPVEGKADPELQALIAKTMAEHLTDADRVVVARTAEALVPPAAARLVVGALREAAGVDAAFIGNTTFGAGLPAGDVTRLQFDACVRFDGKVFVAEVSGARLRELLAAANLTPETPFAQRKGEFNFAAGPDAIDPARTYRVATTDWGARNTDRYFGAPAIAWTEVPGLQVKAAVLGAGAFAPSR
jgi:2',3'-cyclic-nucleotide 2'-phosphodiesterase (5'-nucleotidase family)